MGIESIFNGTGQVEPWVDADALATHLGFKPDHVRKMAASGQIPASQLQNGKRKFWRFKISVVDKALQAAA